MLYPGAFEPHPRGQYNFNSARAGDLRKILEVHLPSAWGLRYEDLTLTTSDKVKIRAYLLLQPDRETDCRKGSLDYSASLTPPFRR